MWGRFVCALLVGALVGSGCGDDGGAGATDASSLADGGSPAVDGSTGTDAAVVDGSIAFACDDHADCGLHQVCDTSTPGGACVCGGGYADTGAGCEFAGLPANPGFNQTPMVWEVTGGVTVLPAATDFGQVEPGFADWSASAVCELGSVRQTFDLAPYDRAEPLVARMSYRSDATVEIYRVQAAFAIDGAWSSPTDDIFFNFQEQLVCLGDAAYGGSRLLEIGPEGEAPLCGGGSNTTFGIDHFSIELPPPGMVCPAPGEILNGDFEAAEHWELAGFAATASIVDGAGTTGSRGLTFALSTDCFAETLARGSISVPRAMGSPALQFSWKGDAGAVSAIQLGTRQIAGFSGDGSTTFQTARVCLPAWTRGVVHPLRFWVKHPPSTSCPVTARSVTIDDLSIVDEPACGADFGDPGFERAAGAAAGLREWNVFGGGLETIEFVSDGAQAHSGTGVVKVSSTSPCAHGGVDTWVTVPSPVGSDGPAWRFWMRAPPHATTNVLARSSASPNGGTILPENAAWTQHTICFDPAWIGRPANIAIRLESSGGTCADVMPESVLFIDDVEVTTSPSCPAM